MLPGISSCEDVPGSVFFEDDGDDDGTYVSDWGTNEKDVTNKTNETNARLVRCDNHQWLLVLLVSSLQ